MENNIRTMEFVCKDDWGNYVYKCIETGILYKDLAPEKERAELYSCGNEIDGEPCYLINKFNKNLKIHFVNREIRNRAEEYNYMMLGRLQSDCDYYLGYGNRYTNHLYYKDEQEHINEMKKLYNSFDDDKKPEWLTMKQIEEYEKEMVNK